jgi:hypothetical protein
MKGNFYIIISNLELLYKETIGNKIKNKLEITNKHFEDSNLNGNIKEKVEKELNEKIEKGMKYISILKDFLEPNEYLVLKNYIKHLISQNELPIIKNTMPKILFNGQKEDKQSIVYLIGKIRDLLYSNNRTDLAIEFLFKTFPSIEWSKETIYRKFAKEGKYINSEILENH